MSDLGVTSGPFTIRKDGRGYEVKKDGYYIAYFNAFPACSDPFAIAATQSTAKEKEKQE